MNTSWRAGPPSLRGLGFSEPPKFGLLRASEVWASPSLRSLGFSEPPRSGLLRASSVNRFLGLSVDPLYPQPPPVNEAERLEKTSFSGFSWNFVQDWSFYELKRCQNQIEFGSGILMAYGDQREVRLWHDKREREMFDNFADLFAIIKTTEKLEKAYVRDVVSAKEYEPACSKLIAQFRTLKTALKDSVPDVEQFADTYKMDCPAALNRLLVSGIPATVEHKSASSDSGTAAAVAECVQIFITAMDTLKLNMLAVDQVHPMMSDLILALSRVPQLSPDFVGKVKVKEWIARLNKMGASEELTQEQARQLSFDLEMSYNGFIQSLPKSS